MATAINPPDTARAPSPATRRRGRLQLILILLLTIGFWRTLFIVVFAALGALAGGIGNKRDAVRVAINRSFPPKDKPLDIEQDTQDKTNKPE